MVFDRIFISEDARVGLAVKRRMPHVEQELSTIPEYIPSFSEVPVARSLFCKVMFCTIVVCPFVLFRLASVLSVLRFTSSGYPFDNVFGTYYTYLLQIYGRLDKYHDMYQCPHCPMLGL